MDFLKFWTWISSLVVGAWISWISGLGVTTHLGLDFLSAVMDFLNFLACIYWISRASGLGILRFLGVLGFHRFPSLDF